MQEVALPAQSPGANTGASAAAETGASAIRDACDATFSLVCISLRPAVAAAATGASAVAPAHTYAAGATAGAVEAATLTGPPAGALTTAMPAGCCCAMGTVAPAFVGRRAGAAMGVPPVAATMGLPGSALTRVPGVVLPGARSGANAGGLLGPTAWARPGAGASAPASASEGAGAGAAAVQLVPMQAQLATVLRLVSFKKAATFWL